MGYEVVNMCEKNFVDGKVMSLPSNDGYEYILYINEGAALNEVQKG